jgi:hypothetical protein
MNDGEVEGEEEEEEEKKKGKLVHNSLCCQS